MSAIGFPITILFPFRTKLCYGIRMQPNEQPILSVTELSLSLKSCVEQVFAHVRVRGEVSAIKTVASGHTYFSLKDSDSVLSAICWRGGDPAFWMRGREFLPLESRGGQVGFDGIDVG